MMKRNEAWYDLVFSDQKLSQGDLILQCPILSWTTQLPTPFSEDSSTLDNIITAFVEDIVVMTQACDLEHSKVNNVVLCPHYSLSDYRREWEKDLRMSGQNPTEKAWRKLCDNIADGYIWNHAMINGWEFGDIESSARIVDFHEVFTLPRAFLEALLQSRNEPRVRLNPPYREHLSQAFARYFMRVGLPTPIERRS